MASKAEVPRIPGFTFVPDLDGSEADLVERSDVEAGRFSGIEADRVGLRGASVLECLFMDSELEGLDLEAANVAESTLDNLNAVQTVGRKGVWRDVEVRGCRIGSFDASEADWGGVRFTDCKIEFLNLRMALARDVIFERCSINELDLGDATLERVAFIDSAAGDLSVEHSKLAYVDLRGLDIDQLNGIRGLSGARISQEQLTLFGPLLAEELGIKVDP